jgi:catechol 2,3-dioxygenase-like lactoylglutathione lyase family enzyme
MTLVPPFKRLTPNLIVADVERSVAFYTNVLGFTRGTTVPEHAPFVFGSVVSGRVEIFFNEKQTATKEFPMLAAQPIGTSGTMYLEVEPGTIERLHERLNPVVPIVMPFLTQWYGVKEFAIADPDGYLITIAERVAADPTSA